MESDAPGSAEDIGERISAEIAAIHKQCYGEEVKSIRTHLLDDAVVCIIDIELMVHERTMLDKGQGHEPIKAVRGQFQETIRSTFSASVEHMTGRKVVGFVSSTHLDPPFSVEFFRLAPARTGSLDEVP